MKREELPTLYHRQRKIDGSGTVIEEFELSISGTNEKNNERLMDKYLKGVPKNEKRRK